MSRSKDSLAVSRGAAIAERAAFHRWHRWDEQSNERARVVLRQMRSIRRQQVNRDIVDRSDLGGEG